MKIKVLTALLTLFCTGFFSQGPGAYHKDEVPLPIEAAVAAPSLQGQTAIALSPDRRWVAYTLTDSRRRQPTKDERYLDFSPTGVPIYMVGCDVWVTNTESGESINLTEGRGSSWAPVWSPDGNYLAFYSDRGGKAQVWVWEMSTKRLRRVSDVVARPFWGWEAIRWMPDSRRILSKVIPENTTIEDAADFILTPEGQSSGRKKDPQATAIVYRSSAFVERTGSADRRDINVLPSPWANRSRADLALIGLLDGKVLRVARGFKPSGYWVSPDGAHIAFMTAKGWEDGNSLRNVFDLALVSLADARTRVIASGIKQAFGISVSWSPDNKLLSYTTSEGDVLLVSIAGGGPHKATEVPHPSFDHPLRAPLWDKAGRSLYFIAGSALWRVSVADGSAKEMAQIPNHRLLEVVAPAGGGRIWSPDNGQSIYLVTRDEETKQEGFYGVSLATGESLRLHEGNKYYGYIPILNFDASEEGKCVVFVQQDAQRGEDIWMADADFRKPRRLTRINSHSDAYAMGESRLIEWNSLDGQRLRAALLLPPGYEQGRRYPLIVFVYGGVYGSDFLNQHGLRGSGVDNLQLLATRGYAILWPDAPAGVGAPMQDLMKTVMPGVDKAIEIGVADPDRLAVMGHSYGGYGVLALLVQTRRFKAAVVSAGQGNLLHAYSVMGRDGSAPDIGWAEEGQGRMGGTPWAYRGRYIENSPVFYLDRVQTPLLIVHGGIDYPPFANEIFVGLRRLGKEVVYVKYEGEGHWQGTWGYANVLDYWNRLIDWFDERIR